MLEQPIVTYTIIALTVLTSIPAMNDGGLKQKLLFYPYEVKRDGEWYRFFTSGFVHADWMHLFFNMFVFYSFGMFVEFGFMHFWGPGLGRILYLLMYITAIPVAETYSYIKHQNNPTYRSLGASGAVSAVLFASILIEPLNEIYFIFLPFIGIPAVIMGVAYLAYSHYMGKKGIDNIGHDAHFYGAIFGFVFPILFKPELITRFIAQIMNTIG